MDKTKWVQSDFTFEELEIGMKVLFVSIGTISEVIDKTSNSIETRNYPNLKSRYRIGQTDISGENQEGCLKGIISRNWYLLDGFNRTFKRVL